jgi:hypothetical protein
VNFLARAGAVGKSSRPASVPAVRAIAGQTAAAGMATAPFTCPGRALESSSTRKHFANSTKNFLLISDVPKRQLRSESCRGRASKDKLCCGIVDIDNRILRSGGSPLCAAALRGVPTRPADQNGSDHKSNDEHHDARLKQAQPPPSARLPLSA